MGLSHHQPLFPSDQDLIPSVLGHLNPPLDTSGLFEPDYDEIDEIQKIVDTVGKI